MEYKWNVGKLLQHLPTGTDFSNATSVVIWALQWDGPMICQNGLWNQPQVVWQMSLGIWLKMAQPLHLTGISENRYEAWNYATNCKESLRCGWRLQHWILSSYDSIRLITKSHRTWFRMIMDELNGWFPYILELWKSIGTIIPFKNGKQKMWKTACHSYPIDIPSRQIWGYNIA